MVLTVVACWYVPHAKHKKGGSMRIPLDLREADFHSPR